MAEKKPDRRTLKTRKAIFEGLAELLTEKELRRITVQELSDKVDIHRVTFYKHFMDIYDVYEQLEKTILNDLGLVMTAHDEKTTHEIYPAVFEYITEHPQYFKMIFSPHNTFTLYQKLLKMVEGLNRLIWSEHFDVDVNDSRMEWIIRYHSNGCLAIIGNWVQRDFAQPKALLLQTLSGLDKSTQQYLTAQLT